MYNWKKKYGGLSVSEVRRLKQLEKENNRLNKLVADLNLGEGDDPVGPTIPRLWWRGSSTVPKLGTRGYSARAECDNAVLAEGLKKSVATIFR